MDNSNNREIEIKFEITDLSALEQKILAAGGKMRFNNVFQRTVRMDTKDGDLQKRETFIRVRSGEKNTITLKKKLPDADENYKERLELEIEIDNIETAIEIIKNLGFTEEFVMEKYRTEYELENTVLALDTLPFGKYLEIEGAKDDIEKTVKTLGLSENNRLTGSYWHLFDDYNRSHGISSENENITF